MQKIVLKIIELFITFILGPLLIFIPQYDTLIGNTAAPIDFAVGNLSSAFVKASLFLLGLILSGFLIPFRGYIQVQKALKAKNFIKKKATAAMKETFENAICVGFNQVLLNLNFRIALPHKQPFAFLPGSKPTSYFKLYDLDGFHVSALHPELKLFKVWPPEQAEGLIGKTVTTKSILKLDTQTPESEANELNKNLTAFQKIHTNQYCFVMTIPIFNAKSKLIGVVCIDSESHLACKYKLPQEYFMSAGQTIFDDLIKIKKLLR